MGGDTEPRDVDPLRPYRQALAAEEPSLTNDSSVPLAIQVAILSQQGIQMLNYAQPALPTDRRKHPLVTM